MVTPYMDHDLAGLLENPDVTFTEGQIKCYMLQLLDGTKYLHEVIDLHDVTNRVKLQLTFIFNNRTRFSIAT